MGAEDSTTFAYCGRDNPVENEIEHNEQSLTSQHHKDGKIHKIQELEHALNETQNEVQGIIDKKNKVNMQFLKLEEDYNKEIKEKTKLMDQLQKSTQRYDAMIGSQKLLEEQYETEIEQYKSSNARFQQELDALMSKNTETTTSISTQKQLQDTITDKEKENVALISTKKGLEDEVSKLTRIIAEYKGNPDEDNNQEKSIEVIELKQENDSLKAEMEILKEDSKRNQEMVFTLNQRVNELQMKLIEVTQHNTIGYTATAYGDDEKQKKMETEQYPSNSTEMQLQSHSKSLKAITSQETDLNEDRIQETLDKTRLVTDANSFVRDRYRTVDHGKNHTIGGDDDDDSDDDTGSSYSDQEQLEIAKMKGMDNDEVMKIQKDIEERKKRMAVKHLSTIGEDDGSGSPGNLFRYNSKANWDSEALVQQKQAMKEHMIYLLQQQNNSDDIVETLQDDNDET